MEQYSTIMLLLFMSLLLQAQAIQEKLVPATTRVIRHSDFGGISVNVDQQCPFTLIERNTRNFAVHRCAGNESILADGNLGQFDLTDSLQANELEQLYVWNIMDVPEDPFVLYNFEDPVRVTSVVITFILLQNQKVLDVPTITMFVSNRRADYPRRELSLEYDASGAPDTGVFQVKVEPLNNNSYSTWCIDMIAQQGTEWIIVSEMELYHEVQRGNTTPSPSPMTTMMVTPTAATTTMAMTTMAMTTMVMTTMVEEITTTSSVHTPSPSMTPIRETMTNKPTTLPSVTSTPTTGKEPIYSQTVFRFLRPQENPYILQVSPNQQSINLNCTAFYNGSNDSITIKWRRNDRVIFNNTDQYAEMNIVSTILKINGQSLGRYTCTFNHSSGQSVRELQIISTESNTEENKDVVKDFPVVTVSAAVGGAVVLFILLVAICLTAIFCRCHCKSDNTTTKANNIVVNDTFVGLPKLHVNSLYSKPVTQDYCHDTFHSYVNDLNIYELNDCVTSNTYSIPNNDPYENIYQESIDPKLLMTATSKPDNCEYDTNTLLPYTSKYAIPACPLTKTEAPVTVTWSNILPVKRLGAGQFGEVILAITMDLSLKDLMLSDDDSKSNQTLVAVKVLKGDDNDIKKEFEDEIKFMARLNHENVVKVLGICSKGDPFIMMEYMENGDLNSYLKEYTYANKARNENELDLPILLYIGLQVANGMKYLASCQFVHRDLAARNCLVGKDYVVKIADFGMSQNLYSSHYFVVKGAAILPIRWMATESFYGKFSIKTDVWSYGVTLWEVFTLCKVTPYSELNDHQLIIDILLGPRRKLLPKPENCPDKLYKILLCCFVHDATQRADFDELYVSLYTMYNELLES